MSTDGVTSGENVLESSVNVAVSPVRDNTDGESDQTEPYDWASLANSSLNDDDGDESEPERNNNISGQEPFEEFTTRRVKYSRSTLLADSDIEGFGNPPRLSTSVQRLVASKQTSDKPILPSFSGTMIDRVVQAAQCKERKNYEILQDLQVDMAVAVNQFFRRTFNQLRLDITKASDIAPMYCYECKVKDKPPADLICQNGICKAMVDGIMALCRRDTKFQDWCKTAYQSWSYSTVDVINFHLPGKTPVKNHDNLDLASMLYGMSVCRYFQEVNVPSSLCSRLIGFRNETAHSALHLVADETLLEFVRMGMELLDRIAWESASEQQQVEAIKEHMIHLVAELPDVPELMQKITDKSQILQAERARSDHTTDVTTFSRAMKRKAEAAAAELERAAKRRRLSEQRSQATGTTGNGDEGPDISAPSTPANQADILVPPSPSYYDFDGLDG